MEMAIVPKEDLEYISRRYNNDPIVNHLYAAYQYLFAKACDPSSDVLELKPELLQTPSVAIVYKDGTWKPVLQKHAWEYQKDPDYLVTIPTSIAGDES